MPQNYAIPVRGIYQSGTNVGRITATGLFYNLPMRLSTMIVTKAATGAGSLILHDHYSMTGLTAANMIFSGPNALFTTQGRVINFLWPCQFGLAISEFPIGAEILIV